MKRLNFMFAFVFLLVGGLFGSSYAQPGFEEANIDWRQFEGETLNVFFARHPWQEAIEPLIPEFEELTGMTVNLSKLPENEYKTRVPADLAANTFQYDVFMTEYYDAPKYQQEGWTADIQPFLDDPELTDADWYNWQDFFPGARDIATIGGQYTDRIAITAEAQVLVYRTDILEELGLDVPTTFDELLTAAQTIEEAGEMSGITLRGGPAIWWPLYGVVRSYGGDYVEREEGALQAVLNSPETREAVQQYAALTQYAPQGITTFDFDEINTAMLTGQAAMYLDSSVIFPRLQDPEVSLVTGMIGIAPFPEGPAGRHGHSHYWTLSLAENSEKKAAAWLFEQWATSAPVQAQLSLEGILAPRASGWEVEGFNEVFPEAFISAVRTSLETAVISPANLQFFELMDPLRATVQNIILDETAVEEGLSEVQQQWESILSQ